MVSIVFRELSIIIIYDDIFPPKRLHVCLIHFIKIAILFKTLYTQQGDPESIKYMNTSMQKVYVKADDSCIGY